MKNLNELFEKRLQLMPKGIACQWRDASSGHSRTYTWFELQQRTIRLKRTLDGVHRPGEPVVLMLENGPPLLVVSQFLLEQGVVVVPVNPDDTVERLNHILTDIQAAYIYNSPSLSHIVKDQLSQNNPDLCWLTISDESELLDYQINKQRAVSSLQSLPDDDVAFVLYTSGSSGNPKGVPLTHAHILSNLQAIQLRLPTRSSDRFYSMQHPAYAFELIVAIFLPLFVGARIIFAPRREALAYMNESSPSIVICTPLLLQKLTDQVHRHRSSLLQNSLLNLVAGFLIRRFWRSAIEKVMGSGLRLLVCGGAAISDSQLREVNRLGLPWVYGYGMTEAGPVVSLNSRGPQDGSVGEVLSGIAWEISRGGELLLQGDCISRKYLHSSSKPGYFHTGDLAEQRHGRLFISGRIDDAIQLQDGRVINGRILENQICANDEFENALVVGDGLPGLVAIVFLAPAFEQKLQQDLKQEFKKGMFKNSRLLDEVRTRVRMSARKTAHAGVIDNVIVAASSCMEKAGYISNGKLSRKRIIKEFQQEIEAFYR